MRREQDALPATPPRVGSRPVVAIVGRPNVGKSTLFNRLLGRHQAIVEDVPGVTRDRHYADTDALGKEFTLIDTGGFDPDSADPIPVGVRRGVQIAVGEADLIVCMIDGKVGVTPADEEAIRLLRKSGKRSLFAANKIDATAHVSDALDLYRLGVDQVFAISALHGRGVSDLLDAIVERLPEPPSAPDQIEQEGAIRTAIVGRPNAGKSSLVNRLLGQERLLVDERPGTTRDAIDALLVRPDARFVLVDTAGIRRQKSIGPGVERHSVFQAIRAMDRSDVVVIMIDASDGAAEQDAKILGLAIDRGCGVVIGLNKWDLVQGEERSKQVHRDTRDKLSFAPWAPIVRLSTKSGRGTSKLLETVRNVNQARCQRISTGALNRFFATVLETHPPPTAGGRSVRLYYVTQAKTAPPTFVISTNYPADVHFSYRRFVVNQIREAFGFEGTPITVHYKHKTRRNKSL